MCRVPFAVVRHVRAVHVGTGCISPIDEDCGSNHNCEKVCSLCYNSGIHSVDDRRFEGMTMHQLLEVAPDPKMPSDEQLTHPTGKPDPTPLHTYLADTTTMTNPDHPILAVNYFLDRGQSFRLIPSELAAVEINLFIGNLGFDDYIAAAGPDGTVRDF